MDVDEGVLAGLDTGALRLNSTCFKMFDFIWDLGSGFGLLRTIKSPDPV